MKHCAHNLWEKYTVLSYMTFDSFYISQPYMVLAVDHTNMNQSINQTDRQNMKHCAHNLWKKYVILIAVSVVNALLYCNSVFSRRSRLERCDVTFPRSFLSTECICGRPVVGSVVICLRGALLRRFRGC
jgi:hypothetical protein